MRSSSIVKIETIARRRHHETHRHASRRRIPTGAAMRAISSALNSIPSSRRARAARSRTGVRAGSAACALQTGPALPPQISSTSSSCAFERVRSRGKIHAALEAVRRLRTEAQHARFAGYRRRLKKRALEQNVSGILRHRAVGAAHDAGQRERFLIVRDDQKIRLQIDLLIVEQFELLACPPKRTCIPPQTRARSNACSGCPSSSIT